jgi:hypothetical protein
LSELKFPFQYENIKRIGDSRLGRRKAERSLVSLPIILGKNMKLPKAKKREATLLLCFVQMASVPDYPPITYYWTVLLILSHSYLVGKSTSSKIADTKVSGFYRL